MSGPDFTMTRSATLSAAALLTSSATLVCCVLPVVFVAVGAGATLASLVTAIPQLIWLSEHKPLVFGVAAVFLAISGTALWFGRLVPCPAEPTAARTCQRLRRVSAVLYGLAVGLFAIGVAFTFVLPRFTD